MYIVMALNKIWTRHWNTLAVIGKELSDLARCLLLHVNNISPLKPPFPSYVNEWIITSVGVNVCYKFLVHFVVYLVSSSHSYLRWDLWLARLGYDTTLFEANQLKLPKFWMFQPMTQVDTAGPELICIGAWVKLLSTQVSFPGYDSDQFMTQAKNVRFWIDSWCNSELYACLKLLSLYLHWNGPFKALWMAAYSIDKVFNSSHDSGRFPGKRITSTHDTSTFSRNWWIQWIEMRNWWIQLIQWFQLSVTD